MVRLRASERPLPQPKAKVPLQQHSIGNGWLLCTVYIVYNCPPTMSLISNLFFKEKFSLMS